jgi:PPOX class probable F420-dependent enzyme
MSDLVRIQEEQKEWRGQIGKMSREELDAFLAGDTLCHLACLKEDGTPYIVPCWFTWTGRFFWIIPRRRSVWARYLQERPAVALAISEPAQPYRKVNVEGKATIVEEPNVGGQWVAIAQGMSLRYLGEHGPEYLEPTLNQPRWLIRVDVDRLTSWQGVAWHPRYVVDTAAEGQE